MNVSYCFFQIIKRMKETRHITGATGKSHNGSHETAIHVGWDG